MRQKIVVSVAVVFLALAGLGSYLLVLASPAASSGAAGVSISPTNCRTFPGLPSSRDNDAGHARAIDAFPDADCDWYQTHPS